MAEELGSHKRLLAENAESLTERRAEVQEYEARVEEATAREAEIQVQLEELYRHNAEEKARYEREREREVSCRRCRPTRVGRGPRREF